MVQSIDTKSLFKHQSSIVDRLPSNNKHRALIDCILNTGTPRWTKLIKLNLLFAKVAIGCADALDAASALINEIENG